MNNKSIPHAAMPVAEAIRLAVPRPLALPTMIENESYHPRVTHRLAFDGLLPQEMLQRQGYTYPDHHSVASFRLWWDEQIDPEAAVDAIWGPWRLMAMGEAESITAS